MSHITLIRHGQANSAARDEASYDSLSDLGHQQAAWLGDHLRTTSSHFPRVYCGTLTRHIQTAASMGYAEVIQDARLNEMEYFTLAEAMRDQHGLPVPLEREGFVAHLPQVFAAWAGGRIADPYESWQAFETRARQVLAEIAAEDGPALVVTSGGLISMLMRQAMGLDTNGMARMTLATMNTSMHRLLPIGGHLSPVLFNAVPHLEAPDRHFAQTHF